MTILPARGRAPSITLVRRAASTSRSGPGWAAAHDTDFISLELELAALIKAGVQQRGLGVSQRSPLRSRPSLIRGTTADRAASARSLRLILAR